MKALLLFTAVYGVFLFAGFSKPQSVLLALALTAAYSSYRQLDSRIKNQNSMSPFTVVIWPKSLPIIDDYKLIADGHRESLEKVWKDPRPIAFTVLGLRPDGSWLIFNNTDNDFQTDIDFTELFGPLVFSREQPGAPDELVVRDPDSDIGSFREIPLRYFCRQRASRVELGIEVRDQWWKNVHGGTNCSAASKTKVRYDHITGSAELVLAEIPPGMLRMFKPSDGDLQEETENGVEYQLRQSGWERQKDGDSEVFDPWIRIEHNYFEVGLREI